tara:strand:+ start:5848 stop:6123 length:276 start_codon:yes stop_codon:yes gene_type:complete
MGSVQTVTVVAFGSTRNGTSEVDVIIAVVEMTPVFTTVLVVASRGGGGMGFFAILIPTFAPTKVAMARLNKARATPLMIHLPFLLMDGTSV